MSLIEASGGADVFDGVVGQERAVQRLRAAAEQPVHAYLFLGPRGTGARQAAFGFAALLLSADAASAGDAAAVERHRRLATTGTHADLVLIAPQGTQFRDEEAKEVIRSAATSPAEGSRKVIVIEEAHTFNPTAIGTLLKVIEEPSASTHFVLLAEEVPPEMITIESRCVTVEFGPVPVSLIETTLFTEGIDPRRAKMAAAAAAGDIDRARLLANDPALSQRAELWASVPGRLDGTGSVVVGLVDELRAAMDAAQEPLTERHEGELAELDERVKVTGERGSGRADLVAQHKREIRRLRADELRFGLATLSRHYRDRLIAASDPSAESALAALATAVDALQRNPNEALLLQRLFLELA